MRGSCGAIEYTSKGFFWFRFLTRDIFMIIISNVLHMMNNMKPPTMFLKRFKYRNFVRNFHKSKLSRRLVDILTPNTFWWIYFKNVHFCWNVLGHLTIDTNYWIAIRVRISFKHIIPNAMFHILEVTIKFSFVSQGQEWNSDQNSYLNFNIKPVFYILNTFTKFVLNSQSPLTVIVLHRGYMYRQIYWYTGTSI